MKKYVFICIAVSVVLLNFDPIARGECISNDCKNGWGQYVDGDKSYIGEFKNGKFHGRGALGDLYKENSVIQGRWENGKLVDSYPVDLKKIEQEYFEKISKEHEKFEDPQEIKIFKQTDNNRPEFYFDLGIKYNVYSMSYQYSNDMIDVIKKKYFLNKSIQSYTKYFNISKDPYVLFNRARSYDALNDYNNSIKDYIEYLKYYPDHIASYYALALDYTNIGNILKALDTYTLIFEIYNSQKALFLKAEIYEKAGDKASAIKFYQKFYDIGVFEGDYENGGWTVGKKTVEEKLQQLNHLRQN